MKRAIRLYRLRPGYYYSRKPVQVLGTETHVVIEESDGGSFWRLRLENIPGFEEITDTYGGAKQALELLIAGELEPVFA